MSKNWIANINLHIYVYFLCNYTFKAQVKIQVYFFFLHIISFFDSSRILQRIYFHISALKEKLIVGTYIFDH